MKTIKFFICVVITLLGGSLIDASATNAEASQSQMVQQSQWIEIGEVTMELSWLNRNDKRAYKKAILYVMQLGDKFIYRIQWQSNFYSVNKIEDKGSFNAEVIIPDGIHCTIKSKEGHYYLNVPQW